jgi:hypothetical protein
MKVSVYYNSLREIKSQILHVDIRSENYYIAWHCLNNERGTTESFYQSDSLSEKEYLLLSRELKVIFDKEDVPFWLREEFTEKILLEEN